MGQHGMCLGAPTKLHYCIFWVEYFRLNQPLPSFCGLHRCSLVKKFSWRRPPHRFVPRAPKVNLALLAVVNDLYLYVTMMLPDTPWRISFTSHNSEQTLAQLYFTKQKVKNGANIRFSLYKYFLGLLLLPAYTYTYIVNYNKTRKRHGLSCLQLKEKEQHRQAYCKKDCTLLCLLEIPRRDQGTHLRINWVSL